MKAERRAYPSWKDDDSKGLSPMIDAELTDLLDKDEEERLEKQKLSVRRKINAPKPRRGNTHNQRANPRTPRHGQPPPGARPGQNMNSHDKAHPRDHASLMSRGLVPPDRPTKAMETSAGPTTNPLTAGDRPPVNLATTDTQLHPVHKLHTLYSRSTEKTQPDRATLRATLMTTTWEDVTVPQADTYYRQPRGRRPFRGSLRGGRRPGHAMKGRQKRRKGGTISTLLAR